LIVFLAKVKDCPILDDDRLEEIDMPDVTL
jgi:hypothetical protein